MVLLVVGVLLIAMGGLWFLQGIGVVGGSAMTGVTLWAIVGRDGSACSNARCRRSALRCASSA